MKFWNFFGDVCVRIRNNPDFGREISGTSGAIMFGVIHRYYPGVDPEAFYHEEAAMVRGWLEEEVPVKPGLYEILAMFKEHGVKLAVASSSREEMIRRNLQVTDTEQYFDVVLSAKKVKRAKPEPDVFLKAAELLGYPPEQCYVFEDSFGGVRAGAAAGAHTYMIPDQVQPTEEIRGLVDGVFKDLHEAAQVLGKTNPKA